MPKATSNIAETHRHELKSCPEGYVVARRLTYGEKLERRAMVSGMKVGGGKGKNFEGEMQLVNVQATVFDFQRCIVEHNLYKDDADQDKFDLSSIGDIKLLDPRIGEEIDDFLSELNNFEDDSEN